MYGAIIGDIIGSTYEYSHIKTKEFELFPVGSMYTDDTILTVAIAAAVLRFKKDGKDFSKSVYYFLQDFGSRYPYPKGGYGYMFSQWVEDGYKPYGSFGNGSAMRVSPCALVATSLEEALDLAAKSANVTHNHSEGIKGAQATAAAIYLAKTGVSKEEIHKYINQNFYTLDKSIDEIRPEYKSSGSCQGCVPQSIQAFLDSTSYEDAIRNVISLGGDADTMGAITGSIAWAYYGRNGLTPDMEELKTHVHLPGHLLWFVNEFEAYIHPSKLS